MKKTEVTKLLTVIAAAYPRFEVDEMKQQIWFEMFQDIDYQTAQIAVKKIMLENTFPPSIAELRKVVVDITTPAELKKDAAEAWGEVEKAIRNFGMYREGEALQNMSPRTTTVVRYMGWQNICTTEEIDVVRGQFRKMYESTDQRERLDRLIPDNMKVLISRLTEKSKLLQQGEAAVTMEG